jgi:hypothetical protein
MLGELSDHGHTHEGIEERSGLDYLWRVGSGEWYSPPPAPGLEGQGDQGFNPESLEPDPESEPMFPHRSTPSVAEAAGPFPAAVRIRRVETCDMHTSVFMPQVRLQPSRLVVSLFQTAPS